MKRLVLCISLITLFFISPHIPADDKTEKKEEEKRIYELDEITVTAPAIISGNRVDRLGSQVTHVSREQIEDLNAMDITSALRRVPGVVISRHNQVGSFGGGEGGAIFIRGKGSSRPGAEIQTLIDGIPKFVSVWTHPIMDVLNVDIVDQIDIYKGAQPVLFGNMAFGVVNIRTKRMKDPGFYTGIKSGYGSNRTFMSSVEHGGKTEKFDYYLLGGYRSSDGHRVNADGKLQDLFFHAGYEFTTKWGMDLTMIYTDNRADDPGPIDLSYPSDGRFNNDDLFTVLTIISNFDRAKGHIKFYRDRGDIDWVDQEGTPGYNTLTDYVNYGIRARETITPWQEGELIMGIDLDYISGEARFLHPAEGNSAFPEETFRIFSPYVSLSHTFGNMDNIFITPSIGVRHLNHNEFTSETAPQAGVILGIKGTRFHASYGRGINYPGIYAKVQDIMWMPGDNRWSELKAENLDHFEAGVEHRFNSKLIADLTWFYDRGKDRIVTSPPPPFPPVLTNIGGYKSRGIEGGITAMPISGLSLFGGFTYLDSEPDDLPYAPEWTFSTGINYSPVDNLQISLDTQYVDGQYVTSRGRIRDTVNTDKVDSYFLVNGKISYDFRLSGSDADWQVFLAAENITDTSYEQKKGYPMPGLGFMIGFKADFN
ncbi:MAG: TonB-dependent receptor plug domain-containing protein [Deltaproteobacteria bacterium]|nr:TonB-dependent receptor plug domain-containing protein [Deltaproteobacteria bacterium]